MPSGTLTLSDEAPRSQMPHARANCKIQPVVMIFDSKPRELRQKRAKDRQMLSRTASVKTFAFVNTSQPGKPDKESRRLVKTHVMQDVLRRKSGASSKLETEYPTNSSLFQDSPCSTAGSLRAPPSYLQDYPIRTEPYMLKLVHDYAGAMLPTKGKKMDSAWFPMVMTDAAIFHALVSTSALLGLHDMTVQKKHMLASIKLINSRLTGEDATSNATICAVLFMAKAEYFQGNYSAWGVHLDGVQRIVELKGGIGMVSCLIQQKIYSTDLLGCMEIGAIPRFSTIHLPKPLSPPRQCDSPQAVVSLATTFSLDSDLLALLYELNTHTTSSPAVHEAPSLQYRLLSLYSTRQCQLPLRNAPIAGEVFCNQTSQSQSEIAQELLLIGALLFLSLPHNLELPPIRPVDYSLLLSRLDTFSAGLYSDHHILLRHPEFLLWLCFLGENFSSSSTSMRVREHTSFRQRLRAISTLLDISSWEDVQKTMGMMWAINPMYEGPYRRLWEDAISA